MNANARPPIRRTLTAVALALCGFTATAGIADAARFKKGGSSLDPSILDTFEPGLIGPVVEPLPLPPPGPPTVPGPEVTAIFDSNGRLTVTGTESDDDVTVAIADSDDGLVRVYDDDTLIGEFPSFRMSKILLKLQGGDDSFFVGLEPGSSHKFEKDIDIKLGAGNDSGFVDFRGNGGSTIVQGNLDVLVIGGGGHDEVYAHFARKHGGRLAFECNMNTGSDDCSASMWGDITGGADVDFDLNGGGGNDHLWSWNTFDQYQGTYANIRVSGDSTFDVAMNGGAGADNLAPTFAGEADGDLSMIVKGQAGGDTSHGIVNLGPSSGGEVKLRTFGLGGSDDLRLDVEGSTPFLSAKINGGFGQDVCQSTPNVSKTNC